MKPDNCLLNRVLKGDGLKAPFPCEISLKSWGPCGFEGGKPGKLKALEGRQAAWRCGVLEETLLGRCRISFIII